MSGRKWLFAATFALATAAQAHDWYPQECCNKNDCAPVLKVEIIPPASNTASLLGLPAHAMTGEMLVTTTHGTVVVPKNMKRRESKDHRMHVCMRKSDGMNTFGDAKGPPQAEGIMYVLCIFMPPAF